MSVFRNLDCLSLVVCSNTTLLKLQTVVFTFFQILCFEIGGAAYTRMFTVAVKRFQMVNLNKMYNYFDYSIQLFYKKPSNLEELTKRDWCDSVRKTGYYIEIKASSQFLVTRGRHMFKNESRKLGVSRLCYSSIFQPSHKVRKHFE